MDDRRLADTGLSVSTIGFGCMGLSHGHGTRVDDADGIEVIRHAVYLGTFFDTAQVYGPFVNEELLSKALAPPGARGRRHRNEVRFRLRPDARLRSTAHPNTSGRPWTIRCGASASTASICSTSTESIRKCPSRMSPEPSES